MTAVLTTLFSFDGTTNGASPVAGLLADGNGDLFGTTEGGGSNGGGTVFELVNNSDVYTLNTLVNFGPGPAPGAPSTAATQPQSTLIADANGDLFGTTKSGGANGGGGTVFEIVNNGTVDAPNYASTPTILANFDVSNGGLFSGVIADANGNLFGTTVGQGGHIGGETAQGTVFELVNNNNGTYTPNTLVTFNGPANGPNNGSAPFSGLIADAKGDLFGTTELGGANGDGTVFEIVNNGTAAAPSYASTPTTLISFDGSNDEAFPFGGLTADANGDLFGTTIGLAASGGTVFELVNNHGTYTLNTLANFNGPNGGSPQGGLIIDANGDLFGTTASGGSNNEGLRNDGTVFEIVNNGTAAAPSYASTPTTLVTFTGTNGGLPEGSLIADANGDLFGTTARGGAGGGTVFEITGSGFVVAQPDHWTNTLGGNWSTAGNWNSGVPTAVLNAEIDASGLYSVAITTAALAYGLLVNDAQATVSDNKGSLTLTGSGGSVNPNGALTIDAGTFVLNGGGLNAGNIFIGTGGALQISKGTYTQSNALAETITDNGSLTDTTSATITGNITGTGTISAANSANLTIAGSLTGSENFTLTNSAHVFIANGVSGTGSFTIANSAVLEFGAANNENITFASGSKGTVKFDQTLAAGPSSTTFAGTISGLTPKDSIDLADLPFTKGQMAVTRNFTATGGTLTVTNQSTNQSVTLNLVGNYLKASWTLSQDSSGTGTLVVDPPLTPLNSSPAVASGPPGLDHVVALFNQYMAAGFPEQHGGSITTNALSQVMANEQQFLANPHHG